MKKPVSSYLLNILTLWLVLGLAWILGEFIADECACMDLNEIWRHISFSPFLLFFNFYDFGLCGAMFNLLEIYLMFIALKSAGWRAQIESHVVLMVVAAVNSGVIEYYHIGMAH